LIHYKFMEKSIMNKKIIAAAVAATMTSVAFADISITGAAKVNYTILSTLILQLMITTLLKKWILKLKVNQVTQKL